jgi:hypothetical protein
MVKTYFPSFPSSGLGRGLPKLELLHTCVPKLELGNKKQTDILSSTSESSLTWFPLVPKLQLGNALPGKLQLPSCYS